MPARFPPSFEDSPIAYAFALFSLALITAISLAVVINYFLEERRARELERRVGTRTLAGVPYAEITLLRLHRLIASGFLLTIIFGALPDVLVLLAWGEASDDAMWLLFQLDRFFDGMTLLPFLGAIWIGAQASQAVDHRLALDPAPMRLNFSWGLIKDKIKIGGLVLCIAVGVTLYKAGSL